MSRGRLCSHLRKKPPTPTAVFSSGEPLSMTSEVMEKWLWRSVLSLKRFVSQAIHHDARGFVCGEKSFDAEFLQCNVQRCAQGSERREPAKRRGFPLVVKGQKRWRSAIQIEHAPTARYVRIAEQFLKERLHRLIRRVVRSFTEDAP